MSCIQDHEYDAVLVDFSWLLHRSFHAFQQQNPHVLGETPGELIYTGDIYGSLDTIARIRRLSPDATIVLCVDSQNPDGTYTNKPAEDYKADRERTQAMQKHSETLACACMIPNTFRARIQGIEADEIIVSLAKTLSVRGKKVLIYSRDKDMNQAITQTVHKAHQIKNGRYHKVLTPDSIQELYGCPVSGLRMWQAIKGDDIDNVVGYPRFFAKYAGKIASRYPTPETFFARNPDEWDAKTEKQAEKLDEWVDDTGRRILYHNFMMVDMDTVAVNQIQMDIPDPRPDILDKYLLREFKLFLGLEDLPSYSEEEII